MININPEISDNIIQATVKVVLSLFNLVNQIYFKNKDWVLVYCITNLVIFVLLLILTLVVKCLIRNNEDRFSLPEDCIDYGDLLDSGEETKEREASMYSEDTEHEFNHFDVIRYTEPATMKLLVKN